MPFASLQVVKWLARVLDCTDSDGGNSGNFENSETSNNSKNVDSSIELIGPTGIGKTHYCPEIKNQATNDRTNFKSSFSIFCKEVTLEDYLSTRSSMLDTSEGSLIPFVLSTWRMFRENRKRLSLTQNHLFVLLKSVEKIKCATRLIYVSLSDFEESIMSWKKLVISVFGEEFYEKLKNEVIFVVENPLFW